MYYMDMGLGQFSSKGNVKMFANLFPAFKGLYKTSIRQNKSYLKCESNIKYSSAFKLRIMCGIRYGYV